MVLQFKLNEQTTEGGEELSQVGNRREILRSKGNNRINEPERRESRMFQDGRGAHAVDRNI